MGVKLAWDNKEKTIIRYDFSEPWTWEDFRGACDLDDVMFNSVDHTVHCLFNLMDIHTVPTNLLLKLPQILQLINPRLGLIVIAGEYTWAKSIAEIFFKVYGHRVEGLAGLKTAYTLDEARQIIADSQS